MTNDKIKKYCVAVDDSIKAAFEKMNLNKAGAVIVVDKSLKVVGVASDGDIRRSLLKENNLERPISECMTKEFTCASENDSRETILKLLDHKIHFVPVLNEKLQLISVVTRDYYPIVDEEKVVARSKSPVRISFGGGGTDLTHFFSVHGGAVLNATIKMYSHCTLVKRDDDYVKVISNDLKISTEGTHLNEIIEKNEIPLICSLLKLIEPRFGFELTISSDFPIGSGLGGSAVALSSILGCFNEFREDRWSPYEISELAFQAERLYLKIAGGWQDQYSTVFGGFNFMEFSGEKNIVHPLRVNRETIWELEECLILCHTNMDHSSDNIHKIQKESVQKNQKILDLVKAQMDLAYDMRESLLRGEIEDFSKKVDRGWTLKRGFTDGISNDSIDAIYDLAKNSGALGGKLLGAGGGGYFLFFVNPSQKGQLVNVLQEKGFHCHSILFEDEGLKSWRVRQSI